MNYYLSGDIGGTKTLLQIGTDEGVSAPIMQKSYASAAYGGLDEMLAEFLHEAGVAEISAACFALAGPVSGRRVALTNLPWEVDADAIADRFAIADINLINDFTAVGMGIAALQPADLLTLQPGGPQPRGVKLVVGAGTGLGVAWLTPAHGVHAVHASEGGHMDFAPADDTQFALLRHLQARYGHVSYERIVSGPGLLAIYEFLRDSGREQPTAALQAAIIEGDSAAALAGFAQRGGEPIASATLDMFMSIYGAFAGNMALASLPRGGVYVAGGIAAKIAQLLQAGPFLQSFRAKGRFAPLLESLPLHIILNPEVGLLGAALCARQAARR